MLTLQEFSAQYTSAYLKNFIKSLKIYRAAYLEFVSLAVKKKDGSVVKYCKMLLGDDGEAKVTAGWEEAVNYFNLKEDNVCMFIFTDTREIPMRCRDPGAWLNMDIVILEEDAGPEVDIGEPEDVCSDR